MLSPGAVALPFAAQVMVEPLSTPLAFPLSFSWPPHVAPKAPLADVSVCSFTSHMKSVHELGEGMIDVEVQIPLSAPRPLEEGARLLLCSKSRQPDVAAAIAHTAGINESFFNMVGPFRI